QSDWAISTMLPELRGAGMKTRKTSPFCNDMPASTILFANISLFPLDFADLRWALSPRCIPETPRSHGMMLVHLCPNSRKRAYVKSRSRSKT
ncbi:hypothetical protein Tco_0984124, partial [Tanacetum coccineum]